MGQIDCAVKNSPFVDTASKRINRYVEKFAVWILGFVIALGVGVWNRMEAKVGTLEDRVAVLFQDKVSRQELKDEMSLVRQQIDRSNIELISRQEQMKGDILSRLELILKFTGGLGPTQN